jgi:hypothetical protein
MPNEHTKASLTRQRKRSRKGVFGIYSIEHKFCSIKITWCGSKCRYGILHPKAKDQLLHLARHSISKCWRNSTGSWQKRRAEPISGRNHAITCWQCILLAIIRYQNDRHSGANGKNQNRFHSVLLSGSLNISKIFSYLVVSVSRNWSINFSLIL